MVLTLALLAAFATAQLATAQEAAPPTGATQYFGMAAGFVTGYGISYRNWPDVMGIQITGTPVISGGVTALDLGLVGLYRLNDAPWTRFFLYFGGQGYYSSSSYANGDGTSTATTTSGGFAGGGIGLELIFFDHIVLDIQGGLQASFGSSGFGLGPSGETGLFYRL